MRKYYGVFLRKGQWKAIEATNGVRTGASVRRQLLLEYCRR